jgi:Tat protein translocase TatB subunit
MFDLGWSEIALIAVVAFVLLGPQDLVRVMRKVGYWTQKARLTLVTYQRMLEAAAYDEDISRMKKELQTLKHETAGLAQAVSETPASPSAPHRPADAAHPEQALATTLTKPDAPQPSHKTTPHS